MMLRWLLLCAAILIPISAQATEPGTIVVLATTGDSLTGCGRDVFFHWISLTSKGDCGTPTSQAAAAYLSDTAAGVAGVRVLALNMGISGTRLTVGGNSFSVIRPTYVDPVAAVKSVTGGARRIYVIDCAIGSNDGAIAAFPTVADFAAAVATTCAAGKTAGFDYALMDTLLPRGDGIMTEPNRLAYNALLTDASWRTAHSIDGVVDRAGQAIVGNPANLPVNNGGQTTYYDSDNVHYNDTSGALLAPVLASALHTLLPAYFAANDNAARETMFAMTAKRY